MGIFDAFKPEPGALEVAPPAISHEPIITPPSGGTVSRYRVEGEWTRDGAVIIPEVLIVEMSEGRRTEKPGDEISLTREEAFVLGRTLVLSPVIDRG